ncbi:type VII secretion target [Streptomyces sp. NPDC000410]|uniref:type VII secretion target n=1 Tax=Streptomyces sp. NPDC000410 TaxID=3154254 RepID=UPI00332CB1C4
MSDETLPEPDKLPLTPDELKKRNLGFASPYYQAPPADSYADPTAPKLLQPENPLQPSSPFLQPPAPRGPQGQEPGKRLRIEPGILNKAAGKADEIYTAFSKPAASIEAPTLAAISALSDWQTSAALREAHKHWEKQAGTVAGWLAHIAESLRAGARDYTKTDAAIEEAFRGVRVRSKIEGL